MDPLQKVTTEGWLELFLAPHEKFRFSRWNERVQDNSITHRFTSSIMDTLASLLPENVAPNVVTLSGLVFLAQAWYVTETYGDAYATQCTWYSVLNILVFFITNSVDTRHADRTRQRTALGDFFKYCCDCASTVFLAVLAVKCLGGGETDPPQTCGLNNGVINGGMSSPQCDNLLNFTTTNQDRYVLVRNQNAENSISMQWYVVQASQLVLFTKHLSAFHRNAGLRYNVLTGPGEVIMCIVVLLAIRATFGLHWLLSLYKNTLHIILTHVTQYIGINMSSTNIYNNNIPYSELATNAMRTFYYAMYLLALLKTLLLRHPHGWSRFGLSASLLARFLPAIFLRFTDLASFHLTVLDVICDGFFMAVLTSDITLAKMAGREVHPWVVLMSMCAVLSHPIVLTLVVTYYIAVFADLCSYLNMPLLTVCRNVFCDGVYDLCHIGHKTLFLNALTFGNRLFVGVVGDEDAKAYKRPPIMTHDERCAEVEACKSVTRVIPNSPCFGLTREFIEEHQIHVVAYGEEYLERWPNPDDDPYYGYVRKIGIARPLPRHDGLSTSDLIRRIQNSRPADQRNDGRGDAENGNENENENDGAKENGSSSSSTNSTNHKSNGTTTNHTF